MNIGKCDICLRVGSVQRSRAFYKDLGFRRVEGSDEEGWAVVVNSQTRIGLFEAQYMEAPFTLNFRGADISEIAHDLTAKGHTFEKGPALSSGGCGSATWLDPDGNRIFFDTAPGDLSDRS